MKTIRLSRLLFERYPTESKNLKNILNKHNIPYEILENTKDIWMRDFMPFCLDDGTLVSYIYEPDYLQGVKYKNIITKINYEINHIDLVIDGGYGDNVGSTIIDLSGDEPVVLREGKGSLDIL